MDELHRTAGRHATDKQHGTAYDPIRQHTGADWVEPVQHRHAAESFTGDLTADPNPGGGVMDRDSIRAFLTEECRRQHIVVESMRRDLAVLNRDHRSHPERTPLHKVELASGLLHDAQAVESYLKRTLAAYLERRVTEVAS